YGPSIQEGVVRRLTRLPDDHDSEERTNRLICINNICVSKRVNRADQRVAIQLRASVDMPEVGSLQQPPYEDYHQFQQTMMEQQQQGFNSINEMLAGMQLQQQNMFQGLQTTQNQYLEELRALKTRQDEFFSNQNNQYNMIRQEQDLMAKEI
ncbi:hypothetical protein PIB30_092155, partial [Stylosanthes scabra]|nr:hypothetical protein [Stylosanthes scabra]